MAAAVATAGLLTAGRAEAATKCSKSASSCRFSSPSLAPECFSTVPLLPGDIPDEKLLELDKEVGQQMAQIPRFLLPGSCVSALQAFICTSALRGCADNTSLPLCRSVCSNVVNHCSWVIRRAMPEEARERLKCEQYVDDVWPRCAAPESMQAAYDECNPGQKPCGVDSATPLIEDPCAVCNAGSGNSELVPLSTDACGVCNGDNSSCGGCDGAGGRVDACGVCGGPDVGAAWCPKLQNDPGLLGYFSVVAAVAVAVVALAALALAAWAHFRRRGQEARETGSGVQAKPSCFARLRTHVHDAQASLFLRLGVLVAGRPWRVLAACVAVSVLLGCGLLNLRTIKDPLSLWVPVRSMAAVNLQQWQTVTGQPRMRIFSVVLTLQRNESASDLRGLLAQAMRLHVQGLAALAVPVGTGGATVGLLSACDPGQRPACVAGAGLLSADGLLSALSLWNNSLEALAADASPADTLAKELVDDGVDRGFSAALLRDQVSFDRSAAGAGALFAMQLNYILDGSADRREAAIAWERAAAELLLRNGPAAARLWPDWKAHAFSEQTLSDELATAIDGDVLLVISGYVFMSIYTSLFLGRHCDVVRSRAAVAGASVFSVFLATACAFGLCAGAGVPYNETVNIALFVLMGVGVDDAFVIVRALEDVADAGEEGGTPDRIGKAMADCGSSIFLSSSTNAVAFAFGATTPLPALRSFCIYASVGMVFDLLFQVTFFVAVLALDERRRDSGRCASLPCVQASRLPACFRVDCALSEEEVVPQPAPVKAQPAASAWRRWSLVLRGLVLALYFSTLVASTIAAFDISVGLQAPDLVPSGSATSSWFAATAAVWPQQAQLVEVIVQHRPLDGSLAVAPLGLEAELRSLQRLRDAFNASASSSAVGPLWVDSFAEHLRLQAMPPMSRLGVHLEREIAMFLNTSTARVLERAGGIILRDGALAATRLRVLVRSYDAEAMLGVRAAVQASDVREASFSHSGADIFLEQDAIMMRYTLQNIIMLMAAVLAVVLLLSADVVFTGVMATCVLSCCTHMFGWMHLLNVPLNALSLIPLLLSVGLCIDYSTHVVHAFMAGRGPAEERATAALRSRAAAVANGAVSTGLSQSLLLFSQSLVFSTFFQVMAGMVLVGLFHALLVLPAFLSLWPDLGTGCAGGGEGTTLLQPPRVVALPLEQEAWCVDVDDDSGSGRASTATPAASLIGSPTQDQEDAAKPPPKVGFAF